MRIFLFPLLLVGLLSSAYAQPPQNQQSEFLYRVLLGRPQDVKLLLDAGADPAAKNDKGWPALAVAAARTDPNALAVVKLLVEAGAPLNTSDPGKNYPLVNAIRNGNTSIARYLLQSGASIHIADATQQGLQQIARKTKNAAIIAIVDNAFKKDAERVAKLKSPENLSRMLYEYSFHSCAYQYMSYYFASKQDKSISEQNAKRSQIRQQERLLGKANDLQQIFGVGSEYLEQVSAQASQQIYNELEGYISNRNRRANGVGKDADLIKRCDKISARWKETPKQPVPEAPATSNSQL